jgi:ADP-ribose pyrophosphatase
MSLRNQGKSSSKILHETPWTRWVERPWGSDFWYGVELSDYVQVIARTTDGKFPLVRQFRPAVGLVTTELVAGLLDGEEGPLETARQELREEAGYVGGEWAHLDTRHVDTGRLDNQVHTYVANNVEPMKGFQPEKGIERILVKGPELDVMIEKGEISNSVQVMGYLLALKRGYFAD